ncbi:Unknown protein, partial [Striga hermonthica]
MEEGPNTELAKELQELEAANAQLSAQLSSCTCEKTMASDRLSGFNSMEKMKGKKVDEDDLRNKSKEDVPDTRREDMVLHHFPRRNVALKVMYFGPSYTI